MDEEILYKHCIKLFHQSVTQIEVHGVKSSRANTYACLNDTKTVTVGDEKVMKNAGVFNKEQS